MVWLYRAYKFHVVSDQSIKLEYGIFMSNLFEFPTIPVSHYGAEALSKKS